MGSILPGRREALALLASAALAGSARGQASGGERSAANQWFAVTSDDGSPVPNSRAPVEIVDEIEELEGAIWAGPANAPVRLIEFYDYNCPWCRAAEAARDRIRAETPGLRVALINNPILSPASAEAARIDLALLRLKGAPASYGLHRRLFETPGRIDGARALEAAASLGHDRGEIEREATSARTAATLAAQMRLAASLGLSATPSYVVGGASILGFPGPRSLARIVDSAARCGTIAC